MEILDFRKEEDRNTLIQSVTEVKVVEINLVCPKCKKGNLIWDKVTICTNDPCFDHWCDKCNYRVSIKGTEELYPLHKFIKI